MSAFVALEVLHVLGAAILFGTGLGIAYFQWMANRTGEPRSVLAVARIVVVADFVFTASAAVLQPATGVLLAAEAGYSLAEPWIGISMALYVLIGACWLPVVWLQLRMRDLAAAAVATGAPLPEAYHRLYRRWFGLGWPALVAILTIYALMIAKPTFG